MKKFSLRQGGHFFLGFLAFLASCKTKKTRSISRESPSPKKSPFEEAVLPLPFDEGSLPNPFELNCLVSESRFDLNLFKVAGEEYWAEMALYGRAESCLLTLSLPKYTGSSLKTLYICKEDGKILMARSFQEGAVRRKDKTMRPLIFDNVFLREASAFQLVYKLADGSFLREGKARKLNLENNFRGKKCYGLTNVSVPVVDFYQFVQPWILQPVVKNLSFLLEEEEVQVQPRTEFLPLVPQEGTFLTDLMGRDLKLPKEPFRAEELEEAFLAYRLHPKDYYLRSIIRLV